MRYFQQCILCLLIVMGLIVSSCHKRPDPAEQALIEATAKPIIEAIEKYKKEKGKYPNSLEELLPFYLASIPKPNWGVNEWDYVAYFNDDSFAPKIQGKGYALSVRLRKNDYQCYVFERYPSGNGIWAYDQ